jgi:beta-propeller repeat-containing protein
MRIPKPVGYAVGVAASIALLAGCSGSGPSSLAPITQSGGSTSQSVVRNHVPTVMPGALLKIMHPGNPYSGKSWASPNATGPLVYACGYYANMCNWYHLGNGTQAGVISGLTNPQGVGVDSAGNVYVANTGASNVPVYPKGGITATTTLDDTGWYPVDVAVASDGTVYVANIFSTSFTAGNVDIYAAGSTTATGSISDPNFFQVISVAVDEGHNVVVCYNNTSGFGACDLFKNASGSGTTVVSGLGFAGGVAWDRAESIVVNDQLGPTTQTFETDDNGATYNHCNSTTTTGDPLMMNLNPTGDDLFIANASGGYVQEQKFRDCTGMGAIETKYSQGWSSSSPPFGTVQSPGNIN